MCAYTMTNLHTSLVHLATQTITTCVLLTFYLTQHENVDCVFNDEHSNHNKQVDKHAASMGPQPYLQQWNKIFLGITESDVHP